MEVTGPDWITRLVQAAWIVLTAALPALTWRAGRLGIGGARLLLVVALCAMVAAMLYWQRPDEPLHANGHAWREAREVLTPWGGRANGVAPYLHGRGAIALQWLIAASERAATGTIHPFAISRIGMAAAAAGVALLVAAWTASASAALAAGLVLAFLPLSAMVALSGSALAIPGALLPWSLALLLGAGATGDRALLAGAALAAALATLSHTAMTAWPAALGLAWLLVGRSPLRFSRFAWACAALLLAVAAAQLFGSWEMLIRRDRGSTVGLLGEARLGLIDRNLFVDPSWVSPVLVPLLGAWVVGALLRRRVLWLIGSVLAAAIVAIPLFAVTACSSDAIRYQGTLLPLLVAFAVAGLWLATGWLGRVAWVFRAVAIAALLALPSFTQRQPADPVTFEYRLIREAAARIPPNALVIIPRGRFEGARVIPDFPDFLLVPGQVVFSGDPAIEDHAGLRLIYLGLACVSWSEGETVSPTGMRPECLALRGEARPWHVRALPEAELPRDRHGRPWTFHRLATNTPFGFFAP
ncbi:MAG TPA: hypothetical protein VEB21_12790 [Terriglobales bacterium]|nr:hypothetical protein [Terriglobales bacterium]